MLENEHHDVRTTLTIDEDVAQKLKAEVRRSGRSFKETLNLALRKGLDSVAGVSAKKKRFRIRVRPLGIKPGVNYLKTSDMLDWVDGEHGR